MTDLLIIDAGYDRLDEAVERVFAAFPLDVKGKKVLLKPNMVGAYHPDRAVTTHPEMIRACIRCLVKRGAEVTVGDNPGVAGYGMNEAAARESGIREAAGPCYRNISTEVAEAPLKSAAASRTIVSRAVLDADVFISLPRFKTHMQTLISGAIKNSYGILAGGEKARFHAVAPEPERFSRLVAEVFAIRPPDLVIMDAIVVMEGNGPSSADLRPLGKIIASRDAAAVDALMAAIMGLRPEDIPTLRAAAELKLGETDLSRISVEGDWSPLPRFRLPLSFGRTGIFSHVINRLWGRLFGKTVLRIQPGICQRCGICFRQCPAGAIEKDDSVFRIDPSRCIRCYCCYELCTYGAVKIGGSWDRLVRTLVRKREGL